MADAAWLQRTLAEFFGIVSEEDLDKALAAMEIPDIGVCNNRPNQNTKWKEVLECAS